MKQIAGADLSPAPVDWIGKSQIFSSAGVREVVPMAYWMRSRMSAQFPSSSRGSYLIQARIIRELPPEKHPAVWEHYWVPTTGQCRCPIRRLS